MLSEQALKLRGQRFEILDKGYIEVVDLMGGDQSVLEAARQTLDSTKRGDDETLIRYLMRHRHTSPFEFAEIVLKIKCPIYVWRQWIRHRTASCNEFSQRYSEAIDDMHEVAPWMWRKQSESNRQGSGGYLPEHESSVVNSTGSYFSSIQTAFQQVARHVYNSRIAAGVAKEQARIDLPLSNYTQAYWKMNLHNLLHFLSLRMDEHAQYEIREYANCIGYEIVAQWCPMIWQAFLDFRLNAITLSAKDIGAIKKVTEGRSTSYDLWYDDEAWQGKEKCRERDECIEKLRNLGLVV